MPKSLLIALALTFAGTTAWAAPKGGKANAGDKKTVVRFDGDTIDGDLMRPDGDLMSVRPELDMPNMVAPPTSFARAAKQTVLSAADAVAAHRAQRNTAGSH